MIIIPLENNFRIRRGIFGIWVLEKFKGIILDKNKKECEVWNFVSNYREIKNLFIHMMDRKIALSEETKSTLLEIQQAYNDAADKVAEAVKQIDLSGQYEDTIEKLEKQVQKLTVENNNLKSKLKKG